MYSLNSLAAFLETDQPTILAFVRDGHLPAPIIVGNRLVRWTDWQVDEWTSGNCPTAAPIDGRAFRNIRLLLCEEQAVADLEQLDFESELEQRRQSGRVPQVGDWIGIQENEI